MQIKHCDLIGQSEPGGLPENHSQTDISCNFRICMCFLFQMCFGVKCVKAVWLCVHCFVPNLTSISEMSTCFEIPGRQKHQILLSPPVYTRCKCNVDRLPLCIHRWRSIEQHVSGSSSFSAPSVPTHDAFRPIIASEKPSFWQRYTVRLSKIDPSFDPSDGRLKNVAEIQHTAAKERCLCRATTL